MKTLMVVIVFFYTGVRPDSNHDLISLDDTPMFVAIFIAGPFRQRLCPLTPA